MFLHEQHHFLAGNLFSICDLVWYMFRYSSSLGLSAGRGHAAVPPYGPRELISYLMLLDAGFPLKAAETT